MKSSELCDQFHQAMLDLYDHTKTECGYRASRFLRMVIEKGGVQTAIDLVMSENPSEGYTFLWEKGRLDLAVEAYVMRPEYRDLFPSEVQERAEKRLMDYGYSCPEKGE